MHKIAVPIATPSLNDEHLENDLEKYLEYFIKGDIRRVFICVLNGMYTKEADKEIASYKFKRAIDFFKANNMEVGVWIGGFGHGSALSHNSDNLNKKEYQKMTGVMGEGFEHGYCPLDKNFENDYLNTVRRIASHSPDMIMLDDDFRLNGRRYHLGCFCPAHLKEFYRITGEEIPREDIERVIFTGGKNKYRNAYMDISKKTLIDFAKKVRSSVDEIDPKIRIGTCMVFSTWDFEGTDGIEIAKAFAGSTKPFIRGFGAPYHNGQSLTETIESERLQAHWINISGEDIEFFTEGDVYPRPRYNVASKSLELFDLALCCTGETDGILKYMFDYTQKLGYETGYIERHIKNLKLQNDVKAIFKNKKMTGVYVYGAMHKVRNFVLPESFGAGFAQKLQSVYKPHSSCILSKNSIPTCYEPSEYPVALFGENAWYIDREQLKNGAILDFRAAKILAKRGIDTGLVISDEEMTNVVGEYYFDSNDTVTNLINYNMQKIVCKEKVKISSVLLPGKDPGVYTYENDNGMKFMVIAGDMQFDMSDPQNADPNYCNNYYRQKQLLDGIEYLCGKKLPAVCEKNPNLYIMAAKSDRSVSILMLNIFADDIIDPVIKLDKEYKKSPWLIAMGS